MPFFPGFYSSMLSHAVDSAEEQDAEYYAQQQEGPGYLTASEYMSIIYDCTDYKKTYQNMARMWVEGFDAWCHENLETPEKSFVMESMVSPREYNFTTDRVFADVPNAVLELLFARSEANGHKALAKVIRDTFTSYDGFMSSYSNTLEVWLKKPLAEWDHNELDALVEAMIALSKGWKGSDYTREEVGAFQYEVYDTAFSTSEDMARVWDHERFDQKVAELKATKAENSTKEDQKK